MYSKNITDHVHYLTHVDNIPSILEYGLLSFNQIDKIKINNKSIADNTVQELRHNKRIENGLTLHDYVPFYFATLTPMQYVRTAENYEPDRQEDKYRQDDLILLEFKIKLLNENFEIIISDGNATSTDTKFYRGLEGMNHVNWKIINTPGGNDRTYVRLKSAEILVPHKVDINFVNKICVYSEDARMKIINMFLAKTNVKNIIITEDKSHFY